MRSLHYNRIWTVIIIFFISFNVSANNNDEDACLLKQIKQANENKTIGWLRSQCSTEKKAENQADVKSDGYKWTLVPYKRNFLALGAMNSLDGSRTFSGNTADIEFQFAAKFQIFPERFNYLKFLNFGYSQKSWWDVGEESLPFAESNYNPELFLDFGGNWLNKKINYQLGIEHESNGRGGSLSRSWNRAYVQGEIEVADYLDLGLKLWDAVEISDKNKDITDYLGNVRLNARFHYLKKVLLDVSTIRGNKVDRFSYQIDFIYKLTQFNAGLFLTYYNGYGESLLSYDRKTESLRAGLVIVYDGWKGLQSIKVMQ